MVGEEVTDTGGSDVTVTAVITRAYFLQLENYPQSMVNTLLQYVPLLPLCHAINI